MHLAARHGHGPAERGRWARSVFLGLLAATYLTVAQPVTAAQEDYEPRVARVSFVEGEASYLNADADEWTAVDVNAPLVTGDRFYSGPDGRAEIQLPGGIDARLSSETELDMLEVSDRAVQVRVGIGTATFRVRSVPAGLHVEFSTPATALVARSRGVYRIDVTDDGKTTVLVREGEADAYLGDDRYRLEQGRGARIVDASYVEGDPAGVAPFEAFDAREVPYDPWDEWERTRAGRIQNSASVKYVDDEVYGVADLDEYGSWSRNETYGPVWRPTHVEAGWAPFTQGRWVWQDPWGWTWVDYAPWGWAPSHHGRWVYVQDAWAWAPGPIVARPVYAPATVGFLGISVNAPGVSVSVGIGPSVGWVPLGWGEPLVPWWGGFGGARRGHAWWGGWGGPRIVNNQVINNNVTNINVTNINYANIDRPRGFTAVSRESFVRGDMQRVDVPHERMRERGALDVIPQRESLFAARPEKLRAGRAAKPSPQVLQRAALSTRDVPAARPAFAQKLERIQRDQGAPVAPRELRQMTRGKSADAPQVTTLTSRGKGAIVPEVNAPAPGVASGARPRDGRRATVQDERTPGGQRGAAQPQAGGLRPRCPVVRRREPTTVRARARSDRPIVRPRRGARASSIERRVVRRRRRRSTILGLPRGVPRRSATCSSANGCRPSVSSRSRVRPSRRGATPRPPRSRMRSSASAGRRSASVRASKPRAMVRHASSATRSSVSACRRSASSNSRCSASVRPSKRRARKRLAGSASARRSSASRNSASARPSKRSARRRHASSAMPSRRSGSRPSRRDVTRPRARSSRSASARPSRRRCSASRRHRRRRARSARPIARRSGSSSAAERPPTLERDDPTNGSGRLILGREPHDAVLDPRPGADHRRR